MGRQQSLSVGVLVDHRYRLEAPRPGPGFGEVWRAVDTQYAGRKVRLKFLRAPAALDEEEFAGTAVALRAIRHDHIVAVLNHGVWASRPYVVWDLGPEATLADWLDEVRANDEEIDLAHVWSVFEQISAGVHAAHAGGEGWEPLVHGCLTPASVVIERRAGVPAEVRVCDIALVGFDELDTERLGRVPGFSEYLAPEQVAGHVATPAVDVFALAVLLAEMLAAPHSLTGAFWELSREGSVRARLGALREGVPDTVWDLVARALSAFPSQRPPSAGAFADELRAVWPGAPERPALSTRPPSPSSSPTPSDSNSNPQPNALSSAGALVARTQGPSLGPSPATLASPLFGDVTARVVSPPFLAPSAPLHPSAPSPIRSLTSAPGVASDASERTVEISTLQAPVRSAPSAETTDEIALNEELIEEDDEPTSEIGTVQPTVVLAAPPPTRFEEEDDTGPPTRALEVPHVESRREDPTQEQILPPARPAMAALHFAAGVDPLAPYGPGAPTLPPPCASASAALRPQVRPFGSSPPPDPQASDAKHGTSRRVSRSVWVALLVGGAALPAIGGVLLAVWPDSRPAGAAVQRTLAPMPASSVTTPSSTTLGSPSPVAPSSAERSSVLAARPASVSGACPGEMVRVEGGAFRVARGSGEPAGAASMVYVSTLCVDPTEVSAGEYARCVAARACTTDAPPVRAEGLRADALLALASYCTLPDASHPQRPMNCVDWSQAAAFCRWRGARLPSADEWEFVAHGVDGRRYPWGDSPPEPERVNGCGPECAALPAPLRTRRWLYPRADRWLGPADVGTLLAGATRDQVLDLAGNVAEWTEDLAPAHAGSRGGEPMRVVRGGSWLDADPELLRADARRVYRADTRLPTIGFRCVLSIQR